ncbi:SapC family protein [Glacieibacterium sp.]|uniref:SapC family protein n=1 Tax=Glacieibacterium sp. TaxID=2860237 RepID=UPI003B004B22
MKAVELEALSPEAHGALRVSPWRGAKPHFVQVVPAEFAAAAATCPLFLVKNGETGQFYVGAMFGFRAGEDLLTDAKGESDALQPLDLERQGFYIAGDDIAIDPAHPRFTQDSGEPLFEDEGLPANYLRQMQRVLSRLKTGVEETDAFLAAMLRHKLVEPIDISLRFDDGETLTLDGLYTISLDAVQDLDDATALEFFRQGYLQLAYCVAGSLRQVPLLARRRNRRLGEI